MESNFGFAGLVAAIKYALPTLTVAVFRRARRPVQRSSDAPRILVTRLDGMGDFIMLSPFLRELRRNYQNSHITLVVGPHLAQLAVPCPYVSEVFVLDPGPADKSLGRDLKKTTEFVKYLRYLTDFAKHQLAGHFDLAIQPRWDVDTHLATLITVLSGAHRIVAYSEKTSREKRRGNFGYDHLITDVLPPGPTQHEVNRNLDIVRYLGGSVKSTALEIWWSLDDQLQAERFLRERGLLDDSRLIAFGIGASKGWTRWPFYGELISLLAKDLGFTPLLLVGPGEANLAREILLVSGNAVLMQHMPLGVVAAVLSRCALFVGNNSGPMHMASAVGIPVVEISPHPLDGEHGHQNDPDRTGSLALNRTIIRPEHSSGDCHGGCIQDLPHCITSIPPERVASHVIQLAHAGLIPLQKTITP